MKTGLFHKEAVTIFRALKQYSDWYFSVGQLTDPIYMSSAFPENVKPIKHFYLFIKYLY